MQNEPMATATAYPPTAAARDLDAVASRSAVSWAAILAGAVLGAVLSIMLMVGGTGLGFLAMSPWRGEGAEASTLAIGSIIWMLVTHIIAFGIAGYVTGRLRSRWTDAMGDEITFRDTAHGFLAWAVSALVTVVVMSSAATSLVAGTAQTGAALVGSGAATAAQMMGDDAGDASLGYYTDALLRPAPNQLSTGATAEDSRQEINRLLLRSLAEGEMRAEDRAYFVSVVADRTGLSQGEAEQRVNEISTQAREAAAELEQTAREAADTARKAAAAFALWVFISMLVGAFIASYMAMVGGRARDRLG